jgi:hypothetical protein
LPFSSAKKCVFKSAKAMRIGLLFGFTKKKRGTSGIVLLMECAELLAM